MSGTLGWPGTWQSCFWLCSRLTLAQSCELDRPRRARPEKEFPFSNFVFFWFCVPTSRSSGAYRSQMESQQVPAQARGPQQCRVASYRAQAEPEWSRSPAPRSRASKNPSAPPSRLENDGGGGGHEDPQGWGAGKILPAARKHICRTPGTHKAPPRSVSSRWRACAHAHAPSSMLEACAPADLREGGKVALGGETHCKTRDDPDHHSWQSSLSPPSWGVAISKGPRKCTRSVVVSVCGFQSACPVSANLPDSSHCGFPAEDAGTLDTVEPCLPLHLLPNSLSLSLKGEVRVHLLTHLGERLQQKERNE
ncbi:uncharacterized protein LOC118501077 [Phyllostomus discolor]|uniref:Uncharacterized protein LOC118501077 n=1 Tax=Phyllostomus discolor TaxID=89673 RepID=A0A7E6DYJ4_9CHIR|nr:uncharacterized protein LOC118501077 [Phyllostomus discolor]